MFEYVIDVSRFVFVFVNDMRIRGGIIVQDEDNEHEDDVRSRTEGRVRMRVPVGVKPGKMYDICRDINASLR